MFYQVDGIPGSSWSLEISQQVEETSQARNISREVKKDNRESPFQAIFKCCRI
jgi:hypothetical protein